MYFVAVVMVIIATYMLFISGSVALCKALQKNKNITTKQIIYIRFHNGIQNEKKRSRTCINMYSVHDGAGYGFMHSLPLCRA